MARGKRLQFAIGIEETQRNLRAWADGLRQPLAALLMRSQDRFLAEAKRKVPQPPGRRIGSHYIRTGELRDSIDIRRIDELNYILEATAPYAVYIEFSKTYGTPFLRPAKRKEQKKVKAEVAEIAANKVARTTPKT